MAHPPYLSPFVLSPPQPTVEHRETFDLYLPEQAGPRPAVVFVHGGPVGVEANPREWPVYVGYGSAVAQRGGVGVIFKHPLYSGADYPICADRVATVADEVRRDPRVDADRVALWFFSGGGLLMADWLRTPPAWLRALAVTYPILDVPAEYGIDPRLRPVEAVADAVGKAVPIVLTRVGLERPRIAATVDAFIEAAQAADARLEVIDVASGQHGFDYLDHTDESRTAVERAVNAVVANLG